MKKIDLYTSLILLVVGCAYFYQTFSFNSPDAAFMPRVYATILITFSVILFVKSFFTKESFHGGKIQHILIAMGIFIVYVFLVPTLGFYISTLLFIFVLLSFRGVRNVYILACVPLGSLAFIYVFFQKILSVPVPMGFLS